jgi:GntR family transcriptional regulator / MocR family aminotransferase
MSDTPLLGLKLDLTSSTSLFEQVYDALRKRIVAGQLASGDCLPSSRKLADELGVSRTTIVTAYDQLIAEGFAQSRPGSGVFVSEIGGIELQPVELQVSSIQSNAGPAARGPRPFAPGQPDLRLFPFRHWARCVSRVARTDPKALVINTDPFGDLNLRSEICRYLGEWRGVKASSEQIMITAGSGDALEISIRTLIGDGDMIALEDPGYPPLRAFADSLGLNTFWLKMDEQGALPPEYKNRERQPKLAILTPSSQFPLGGVMPQARRNLFLNWAIKTDSWIVEDDYDSEFRYAGQPISALAGLDQQQRTLYVGSFSKIFSNGLRIGFIVIPPKLIPEFTSSLQKYGRKASIVPQRAMAHFMASGEFYRHIRRVRRIYAERRMALIGLLRSHLGDIASFDDHHAGMQVAVKLPRTIADKKLSALTADNGITCTALSTYYASETPQNGLLLGFCSFTIEEMEGAFEDLLKIIRSMH